MRFLRQSLTGLFLLSLTLGLLVYAGYLVVSAVETRMNQEPRMPRAQERVFAVNTVAAGAASVRPVLKAFGEVQSRRSLEIRASAGGRVVELADSFEDGGEVEAGQLLARIDPAEAETALERARADLQDAEAELEDARRARDLAQDDLEAASEQAELRERAYQRQSDLQERGVGTAATVEEAELAASSSRQAVVSRRQSLAQAEARISLAETALSRARLALSEAERQVEETEIRAGFAGTLSDVTLVEGGLVNENEQLAQLVDGDALEVRFRVSTAQYARLLDDEGDLRAAPVTVRLDLYGTDLVATGTIRRASAAVEAGQTGRLIFARLDEARGLKPGDFVTVEAEEPRLDDVVRLPATALDAAGRVLVLDAESRLREVPVELLRRQGDDILVSAEGVAGEQVVAQRTPLLGAGIKVRPVQSDSDSDSDGAETASAAGPEAGSTASADATGAMVQLSEDRRARLVAYVQGNDRIPDEAKERIIGALNEPEVPEHMVQRIESRMGG
ncbi:HlyD family efflux transporter periplasmic adaptor subunit [Aquicoccus sp. SCR17]|nr:HlyD family efflux transporter periplasmic adaptor subunit [Carideicomes alvinocaridis]